MWDKISWIGLPILLTDRSSSSIHIKHWAHKTHDRGAVKINEQLHGNYMFLFLHIMTTNGAWIFHELFSTTNLHEFPRIIIQHRGTKTQSFLSFFEKRLRFFIFHQRRNCFYIFFVLFYFLWATGHTPSVPYWISWHFWNQKVYQYARQSWNDSWEKNGIATGVSVLRQDKSVIWARKRS